MRSIQLLLVLSGILLAPVRASAKDKIPAVPPPTSSDDATTNCNVVGNWSARYPAGPEPWQGKRYTAEFTRDGWFKATGAFNLTVTGYAFAPDDSVLTLTNSQDTGPAGCPSTSVGHFALTFNHECTSFTAAVQDEQCDNRRTSFDRVVFKRR